MPYPIENPMVLDHLWDDAEKVWGVDAMGDEIMEGDPIVEIDGEVVLRSNLEDYLAEYQNAKFTYAT
ncbi:hypothetical protein [Siminovitchia sp. FSL W7-1587]|uniref:YqaI family protein n=1 Tax=Siminovitchia sp. FSL W7-1587 TaxID=2954699 RepID=UPI0030CEB655